MSYDEYDAAMDYYYEEVIPEIIGEFRSERLQSFYRENPEVAAPAVELLADARSLRSGHPDAALVMAVASAEVGLKNGILRPIVCGMVHSETVASLIAELTVSHPGLERYGRLLDAVVDLPAKFNTRSLSRQGPRQPLLDELAEVVRARNALLHRGEHAQEEQVDMSIAVAESMLTDLLEAVLESIGLHAHEDHRVCTGHGQACIKAMYRFRSSPPPIPRASHLGS